MEYDTTFSKLSDDVTLQIFNLLESDPRNWARLSCVCTKFNSLITSICFKSKCLSSLSSDLLSLSSSYGWNSLFKLSRRKLDNDDDNGDRVVAKRQKRSHLATGAWNLSREQGMKLLASRFRDDCLYISDWPGCIHNQDKRNYMLFRGLFYNFKKTRVWRTINDGNHRSKIDLNCAFCSCNQTWDLHSAFCLKRGFGFHDDGEPVVRAYVCENGHVSGAWTDFPLYT
ncbi:Phytochrome A-associated F-box protein [Bienertia sinuspersici]